MVGDFARDILVLGMAGEEVAFTDVLEQRARDLYDGYWGGQASFAMWLINTPEGEAIARSAPEDYDPLDEVEGRLPPAPRLPHTED